MGEKILREASAIMPISAYIDEIVRKKLPGKPTYTDDQKFVRSVTYFCW